VGENQEADNNTKAFNLKFGNKEYQVIYEINNAKLLSLRLDLESKGLVASLNNKHGDGELQITFPRELLDAKNDTKDASFKVFADDKQIAFKETTNTALTRGVSLAFPSTTKEIKIIGTYIIAYSTQSGAPKGLQPIQTMIFLDPPPSQVGENSIVYFSGKLKTSNGVGVQGATILIRYSDLSGNEPILGSSTTDVNGKFIAQWSSKIVGVTPINVYAVFDGNDDYLRSKSRIYDIVVGDQKPSTIVTYTDKKVYQPEDMLTVSGTVKEYQRSTLVGIEIVNPEGRYFRVAQAPVVDGSFSFTFKLGGDNAVPGKYTVVAAYWHDTVETSFLLDGENVQEAIETVLSFNRPKSVIEKGDVLLFTGSLMSSDKQNSVPGATVWIKCRDGAGKEHALVSAVTDDEGKFYIKWPATFSNSGTVHMYAVFDGERGFTKAVSQEYETTLAEPKIPIIAKTDKKSYMIGETVKITGSVTPLLNDVPVLIQIINQQHLYSKLDIVNVSPDGSFEHEFKIIGNLAIVGTYKIKIAYDENLAVLQIKVNKPKFDMISIEDLVFVNAINLPVNELQQGKTVFLKLVMKNNANADQSFLCILHMQDSEKNTVLIEPLQYVIRKGETFTMEMPWVPESLGDFTTSVFLIESEENPMPVVEEPASLQVSVYA
jgi:hypothetical protein